MSSEALHRSLSGLIADLGAEQRVPGNTSLGWQDKRRRGAAGRCVGIQGLTCRFREVRVSRAAREICGLFGFVGVFAMCSVLGHDAR
jgi:hypothetical protein